MKRWATILLMYLGICFALAVTDSRNGPDRIFPRYGTDAKATK